MESPHTHPEGRQDPERAHAPGAAPPRHDGGESGRTGAGRSTGDLLRSLSRDAAVLFRKEAALLRAELRDKVDQVGSGVTSLGAGALVAFAGFLVLLDAAVYGLARWVEPLWLSALIVGGIVALIGLGLLARARSHLKAEHLAPERTAASLQKDVDMARSHGERSESPGPHEPMPGARST